MSNVLIKAIQFTIVTNSLSALIYANTQRMHHLILLNVLLEAIHIFVYFFLYII